MPVLDPASVLIDTPQSFATACGTIAPGEVIAIDTEFMRTTQFSPRLCLTQIAVGDHVYCIDELAQMDTTPLWQSLGAGRGLRVMHAAKQDMEVAWVRHRCLPQPLFDTQIAAALVGHPAQIGYAGLVKALLGVDVDKTHTRADWTLRPLAPELISYAASDVLHLPVIHRKLGEQLESLGRYAWAVEDSARLVDPALYIVDPAVAWRRLSGLSRLPVPAQLRARRLARWREEYALRADRPRQWILGDRSLLDIAVQAPGTAAALAACAEVKPGMVRHQGDAILQEVAAATDDIRQGADLRQESRVDAVDATQLKRLGQVVEEVAKSLAITPEILATRKDLISAMRGEKELRPMAGWRRTVIGEPLLEAVSAL